MFQGEVDAGNLIIRAAQGAQHEQIKLGFGETDPSTTAGFDKGTYREYIIHCVILKVILRLEFIGQPG